MTATTAPERVAARAPIPAHRGSRAQRLLQAAGTPGGGVFVLAAVLLVAVIVANPDFGEPGSLIRFVGRTAPIAIAAMGQYFVIVSGEFDLSMGAVVTATVVMSGHWVGQDESRVLPVLVLLLVAGGLVGVLNGLLTTLLKVPSFIVTLGTMLALSGLVLHVTGGAATGNPADSFRMIGRGDILDVPVLEVIPYPAIILLGVAVLAVVLARRPFGRTLVAAGDNPAATRLSGASMWWLKTRAFVLSSVSAVIAGVILVGYAGVHPSVGQGYEFTAITAVVLGGVVLGGGRGWVLSAAAGAFALELLFTLLTFLGVQSTWRDTVQGVIIILAVAVAGRAWRSAGPARRSAGPARRSRARAPDIPAQSAPSTAPPAPTPGPTQGEQ